MEEVWLRLHKRAVDHAAGHTTIIRALQSSILPAILDQLLEPATTPLVCQFTLQSQCYVSLYLVDGTFRLHIIHANDHTDVIRTLNVLYDMLRSSLTLRQMSTPEVSEVRLIAPISTLLDESPYSIVTFNYSFDASDDLLEEFLLNDALIIRNRTPSFEKDTPLTFTTSAVTDRSKQSTGDKIRAARTGPPPKKEGLLDSWLRHGQETTNSQRYGIEIEIAPWTRYLPEYDAMDSLVRSAFADQAAGQWSTSFSGELPDVLVSKPAAKKKKSAKNAPASAKDAPAPEADDFSAIRSGWENLGKLVELYRTRRTALEKLSKQIDKNLRDGKIKPIHSVGVAIATGTERDPAIPQYVYTYSDTKPLLEYHRLYNTVYGDVNFMENPEAFRVRRLEEVYTATKPAKKPVGDAKRPEAEDARAEGEPEPSPILPITKYIFDLDSNFIAYANTVANKTKTLKKLIDAANTRITQYRMHIKCVLGAEHAARIRMMFRDFGIDLVTAYDKQIEAVKTTEAKVNAEYTRVLAAASQAKTDAETKAKAEYDNTMAEATKTKTNAIDDTKRTSQHALHEAERSTRTKITQYLQTDTRALPSDGEAVFQLCHITDAKARAKLFRDLIAVDAEKGP